MQTLFSTCWLKRSHPSGQFWITACFKTWTAPASCSTRLYHAVIASMIHFTLAQRESMSWSKFQVWKHWSTMDVRYITRNSFTLSWTHCSTCQANIWRRDKAICHSNAPRFTGFRFFNERNQHLASSEKFIVHKKSLSQEADSHVWWVTPTFDWYMMVCIYIYIRDMWLIYIYVNNIVNNLIALWLKQSWCNLLTRDCGGCKRSTQRCWWPDLPVYMFTHWTWRKHIENLRTK